ncbi:nuclear transport factor 2 family protein [Streptomyces sp. NPDC016309]|uniref:nuclear transport factor 2 family protein n=1 Tax=Streptomyces sp. NPDC016309 TaxID=3364965 RepID=UPI0036FBCFD0
MHPHEALVRTCLTAISSGDADTWLSCYTPDAESEDVPLQSVWKGTAGLDEGVRSWLEAIPDTRMEIRSVHAGDHVGACEWTMTGTLRGSIDGLPPEIAALAHGKTFSMRGATVYTFSPDGRIRRESLYWDLAGVLGQFGVLPAP